MQAAQRLRSALFTVSVPLFLLVGFAAFAPFAYGDTTTATPALVQSTHNSTAGAATFANAVTTGNTVIVGVTAWQTSLPAGNITDSKGNTYTRVGETVNATTGDHAAIYYAKNVTGGSSFTVTSSAGGTVAIFEYSGLSTTSPLDKTASATGFSNIPKSANVTTASGNELYFGLAWSGGDGDAWTAGPGYVLRETETNNSTSERLATEDMVLANGTTTNASFKTTTSSDWIAMIATFVPQTITTGGTPTRPAISSFTATPSSITSGQSSTLAWNVTGATLLTIDNGVGAVTGTSKTVSPTATTTYTLTASNSAGTTTATVTINVAPAAQQSNNLVTNGNFESGTTGNPTGWTHDYWGSMTPTFTYPVTGNGGGKAVQIQVTNFSSGAANWIFPHITDTGHDQYQYTEDYMSTAKHELDIEYLMKDGSYDYEWLQTVPASASWRTITAQITPPVNAVSFTVLDGISANGTLNIDNVSVTPLNDPFPNGMVSFTFDDGLLSPYQNAVPMLKAAGFNAGFYIITTEPTSGDTGYMTWAQIKDLQSQGYEIGGHTRTHPYLTTLTTAQQTNEISGSYQDLVAQGITPKSFVYPYGDENPTVEAEVKAAGYNLSRGSYTGENGTVSNRYALYDIRVDSTTNLATLESEIDQAKADHRWLILELHDVLASGGDVDSVTPSFLQSVITYVKNSGVQVVTMQQGQQYLQ